MKEKYQWHKRCTYKTLYAMPKSDLAKRLEKLLKTWSDTASNTTLEEISKTADMYLFRNGNTSINSNIADFFAGYGYNVVDLKGVKNGKYEYLFDKSISNKKYYRRKKWKNRIR